MRTWSLNEEFGAAFVAPQDGKVHLAKIVSPEVKLAPVVEEETERATMLGGFLGSL